MATETLKIESCSGNIFSAPRNSVLVNIVDYGTDWTDGILKQFRLKYGHAYRQYSSNYRRYDSGLIGTAQLSLPTSIYGEGTNTMLPNKNGVQDYHFIGSLTTMSCSNKCSEDISIGCTISALIELLQKINTWNRVCKDEYKITNVVMCKALVSTLGVYWKTIKDALETIDVSNYDIKVVRFVVLNNI